MRHSSGFWFWSELSQSVTVVTSFVDLPATVSFGRDPGVTRWVGGDIEFLFKIANDYLSASGVSHQRFSRDQSH